MTYIPHLETAPLVVPVTTGSEARPAYAGTRLVWWKDTRDPGAAQPTNVNETYDQWASKVIPGAGGGGADTTAPTVPGSPGSTNITSTGFRFTWTAATDAVGVTAYRVRIRTPYSSGTWGSWITPTTATLYHDFSGLTASTTYGVEVQAGDAAGNWSASTTELSVSTSSGGGTPPTYRAVSAEGGILWADPQQFNFNANFAGADVFVAALHGVAQTYGTSTYGGNTMTNRAQRSGNNNSSNAELTVFQRAGGGTTSNQQVSVDPSSASSWGWIQAISYSGVASIETPVTIVHGSSSSTSAQNIGSPVNLAANQRAVCIIGSGSAATTHATISAVGGGTERFRAANAANESLAIMDSTTDDVQFTATFGAATATPWVAVIIILNG